VFRVLGRMDRIGMEEIDEIGSDRWDSLIVEFG
jgi:hypothetical protein